MNKLLWTSIAATALWCGGCTDSDSSYDADAAARAAKITADTVRQLLAGDDDFTSQQTDLTTAVATDPANVEARAFLATVTMLRTMQREMSQNQNTWRLLERAGIQVQAGQTFWDTTIGFEDHGQGLFKDTTPTLDEIAAWIDGTLIPALDAFVKVLESVPEDWEYVVPAKDGGRLLAWLSPNGNHSLRFDYADAQTAAAIGHLLIGAIESFLVLDWDNLAPNDFDIVENPSIDVLDVLETRYPAAGTLLRLQLLTQTRDRLRDCFGCYEHLRLRLRNEDQVRQQEGIVTLGRNMFATPTERQQFLNAESVLHDWMAPIMTAMWNGEVREFDMLPDGTPIPAEYQFAIDFGKFFAGVDPRQTYFKTFIDPFEQRRILGVTSLDELTDAMASFGGALAWIGGAAPERGWLQEMPGYALRRTYAQIPFATKAIDGVFGDWDRDRDQVMLRDRIRLFESRPELGQLFVARDNTNLYVFLDTDLTTELTEPADTYEIDVEWENGMMQQYTFQNRIHGATSGVQFRHNAGGVECAFPQLGATARIRVRTRAQNQNWDFDVERGPVYLSVRS